MYLSRYIIDKPVYKLDSIDRLKRSLASISVMSEGHSEFCCTSSRLWEKVCFFWLFSFVFSFSVTQLSFLISWNLKEMTVSLHINICASF